jgi:hypothetical protein
LGYNGSSGSYSENLPRRPHAVPPPNLSPDMIELLEQQRHDYGTDMFETLTPEDDSEVERLLSEGYQYFEALLEIFSYRYPPRPMGRVYTAGSSRPSYASPYNSQQPQPPHVSYQQQPSLYSPQSSAYYPQGPPAQSFYQSPPFPAAGQSFYQQQQLPLPAPYYSQNMLPATAYHQQQLPQTTQSPSFYQQQPLPQVNRSGRSLAGQDDDDDDDEDYGELMPVGGFNGGAPGRKPVVLQGQQQSILQQQRNLEAAQVFFFFVH